MAVPDGEDEIDLRHYFDVLARRKRLIIAITLGTLLLAAAYTLQQTPMYRATAEVLLQSSAAQQRLGSGDDDDTVADQNRVDTEIGVIESDLVRDAVAEELGRRPRISASPVGDTDIVEISASAEDADEAAAVANLYATTYLEWRRERTVEDLLAAQRTVQTEIDALEAQLEQLVEPVETLEAQLFTSTDEDERAAIQNDIAEAEAQIEAQRASLESTLALYRAEMSSLQVSQRISGTGGAQVISRAAAPGGPSSPAPLRNAVLALVSGLIVGVAAAFALEALDDRVRSKDRLEQITGWNTVGMIPTIVRAKAGHHDLTTIEDPKSPSAEAFRALRTSVQFIGLQYPLGVIQVTSPKSGDGKTTTAANLAVTMAMAGRRVVLLDADLRKPRLHEEFGVSIGTGFTSMLLDYATRADAFRQTGIDRLALVTAGPPPPNPSELLSLPSTRDVIERIRRECDVLVIDSPPVLPVTDPLVLSNYVDGVLVVTDAKTVRARELARTKELLEQVNATVIGVSINRVSTDDGAYGYGYGYGYGEVADAEQPAGAPESGRRRALHR